MRQAITTKFHGPTDTLGSRVSARADAERIVLSWGHALNSDSNHIAAASALAKKFGWNGHWYGGGCQEPSSGYVFVCKDGLPDFVINEINQ